MTLSSTGSRQRALRDIFFRLRQTTSLCDAGWLARSGGGSLTAARGIALDGALSAALAAAV